MSQRRNHNRNYKIVWDEWKWNHNTNLLDEAKLELQEKTAVKGYT